MEGRFARITGTGSALPTNAVPNSYFESILDTSDEWIVDRTGIEERRFAGAGETTATLAADAAARALDAAGVPAQSVDMLIVATCTPDRLLPSTAAFVQARLGMACPGFDLGAACSGFVYGLSVGESQIRSGAAERVVLVGSEVLSRYLDMKDRTTSILFGDGAGAVVLEPGAEPGLVDSVLALNGRDADLLTIPAGGSEEPSSVGSVTERRHFIRMADGRTVFKQAVTAMSEACLGLLEKNGLTPADVDVLVAHQANARIITAVGKRLGIDTDHAVVSIQRVGNTSAASIPIALDEAWRSGRVKPDHLILTTAFGAGMTWGANLLRWTAELPARTTTTDRTA
jgi:3-oxoacyl-[acyl-carrier-protein] synthase III